MYKPVARSTAPAPPDHFFFSRLHLLASLAYFGVTLGSIALLVGGAGTRSDAGYLFGDQDSQSPELAIVIGDHSVSVAESLVPCFAALLFCYHAFVWYWRDTYAVVFGELDWNPLAALAQVPVALLTTAQVALLARIAAVELIAALASLAALAALLDALALLLTYVDQRALAAQAGKVTGLDPGLAQLHAYVRGWLRGAAVGAEIFASLACAQVWMVLLTNVAWQVHHSNTPGHTLAVFVLALTLSAAWRCALLAQVLIRRDGAGVYGLRTGELLWTLLTLALTLALGFISLPASL